MLKTRKILQRGFTLIEMVITIVIMGIIAAFAFPSFKAWSDNQKIRSAAEGVLNGLQLARLEALKRNQSVDFLLTSDPPTSGTVTATTSGKNWVVRYLNATTASNVLVQGWSATDSSGSTSSAISYNPSNSTITFNSLGRTTLASSATFDFDNSGAGTCLASGGSVRCLRINVQPGGEARMCDPSISVTGDTRKC